MRQPRAKRSNLVTLALALASGLGAIGTVEAETFWALENGGPHLRVISRTSGADLATISSSVLGRWRGIAVHPHDGLLYASETEYLYSIVKSSGVTQQIGLFGDVLIRDLTFDHQGQLYGISGNQGSTPHSLHSINAASGAATFIVPLSGVAGHGIAHDTTQPGTLYHLAVGTLFDVEDLVFEEVVPASGSVTPIGVSGDAVIGRPLGLEYDRLSDLFRFFDDEGLYYTIERDGTVTNTGAQNPTLYSGLGYDVETFEPVIFSDGFESGSTDAWSGSTP